MPVLILNTHLSLPELILYTHKQHINAYLTTVFHIFIQSWRKGATTIGVTNLFVCWVGPPIFFGFGRRILYQAISWRRTPRVMEGVDLVCSLTAHLIYSCAHGCVCMCVFFLLTTFYAFYIYTHM